MGNTMSIKKAQKYLDVAGFVRFDPLTGTYRLNRTGVCFGEDDPPGDPPPGDPPPGDPPDKTFSQEQVEKLVQARVGKLKSEVESLSKKGAKFDDVAAQLADLKAKMEDAGADDKAKEYNALNRKYEALKTQAEADATGHAEAFAARDAAVTGLDAYIKSSTFGDALLKSGALPSAVSQAAQLMMGGSEAELATNDQTGVRSVESITVDGALYTDPLKAAEAWLGKNKHFLKSDNIGGGGTPRPGAVKHNVKDLDSMSTGSLLSTGLATPQPK